MPRAHRRGHDLGGRRQPPARGQLRPARALAVEPHRVLRALGDDVGVPGAAQGALRRRRRGAGAGLSRRPVADDLDGQHPRQLRDGRTRDASSRHREHPAEPSGPSAQARRRGTARRGVRGAAAAARARPRRRLAAQPDDGARPEGADRGRLCRPPRRRSDGGGVRVPPHARAPHPAVQAAPQPHRARRAGGPAAHRPQHGVPAEPGGEPHARVAGAPPHRPAAAREALLPTAARGGRVAADARPAAHSAGCRAAAHRAGLRRSQGRARAHPGADVWGVAARGDPEVAAARDARLVRRVARPRRRSARVPQDLRGPRRDALVSPQAPRRG